MKEMEIKDLEIQGQIKLRELEIKNGFKTSSHPISLSTSQKSWDYTRHVRLVQPFNEREVDKYFLHFEKVAQTLQWPQESLTMLLQSVFLGNAQDIYSPLAINLCAQDDEVKTAILRVYELVPEA